MSNLFIVKPYGDKPSVKQYQCQEEEVLARVTFFITMVQ